MLGKDDDGEECLVTAWGPDASRCDASVLSRAVVDARDPGGSDDRRLGIQGSQVRTGMGREPGMPNWGDELCRFTERAGSVVNVGRLPTVDCGLELLSSGSAGCDGHGRLLFGTLLLLTLTGFTAIGKRPG